MRTAKKCVDLMIRTCHMASLDPFSANMQCEMNLLQF